LTFYFPQRLSAFRHSFPIFLTGFPISSTAFHFPRNPRKSIYGPFWGNALVPHIMGDSGCGSSAAAVSSVATASAARC
jgi:hypothetical protein